MTHWLDLSQVYGSSPSMARELRTLRGGRLRVGSGPDGQMLPDNPTETACKGTCFKASVANRPKFRPCNSKGSDSGRPEISAVKFEQNLPRTVKRAFFRGRPLFGVVKNTYILSCPQTLLRISHLCFPRKGIARTQSQFPYSCVCR